MSRQRLTAVIGAIALAVLGTIGMVAYVGSAEQRAASGEELAQVFVVQRRVPAGTAVDRLPSYIKVETVPQKLVTGETVGSLADVEGLVPGVELLPGEILSIARFVNLQEFDRSANGATARPAGLQELTLSLSPERAAGGLVSPGDTVGVLMTFDPFDVSNALPVEVDGDILPPGGKTNSTTFQTLHKLLVTNVQLEEIPEVAERQGLDGEEARQVRLVPSGNLLITLAVDVTTAERLIFGTEFGRLWLTSEPDDTVQEPSTIQTRGTVYEDIAQELTIDSDGAP